MQVEISFAPSKIQSPKNGDYAGGGYQTCKIGEMLIEIAGCPACACSEGMLRSYITVALTML